MPAGLLVTEPLPVPATVTASDGELWMMLKTAVTASLALSVTAHVGALLQLPLPVQPAKDEPAAAIAVKVTTVPGLKFALQVCPQSMPDGALVTLPFPVPFKFTVSIGEVLKFAVTEVFWVRVTLQTPVPLQAPDQPEKNEFAPGEAVSVTWVPLEKLAVQVLPQLMPAGLLLTVPPPAPVAWTVN